MKNKSIDRELSDAVANMAFVALIGAARKYRDSQREYAREAKKLKRRSVLVLWADDVKFYAHKATLNANLLTRCLAKKEAAERVDAALEVIFLWNDLRLAWALASASKWMDKGLMAELRAQERRLDNFLINTKKHGIIGDGGEVPPKTGGA